MMRSFLSIRSSEKYCRGPLDPNTEVVVAVPQCYQIYARQK